MKKRGVLSPSKYIFPFFNHKLVSKQVHPALLVSIISSTVFATIHCMSSATVASHHSFCWRPLDLEHLSERKPTTPVSEPNSHPRIATCSSKVRRYHVCEVHALPSTSWNFVAQWLPCRTLLSGLQSFIPTWFEVILVEVTLGLLVSLIVFSPSRQFLYIFVFLVNNGHWKCYFILWKPLH